MAYTCSLLWHLTDGQLLTHYNSNYLQNLPRQQCTLQPRKNLTPLFALQRKQQLPELFLLQLQILKHGGSYGWQIANSEEMNPTQNPSTTHTSNYLAIFAHKVCTRKSAQTANHVDLKYGNHLMCQWPEDYPSGAQSPWPTFTIKWNTHHCSDNTTFSNTKKENHHLQILCRSCSALLEEKALHNKN